MTGNVHKSRVTERKMGHRDIWFGIVLIATGLFLYFVLIPWQVDVPSGWKGTSLSPAFLPKIIAVCISVLGISLSIYSYISHRGLHATSTVEGASKREQNVRVLVTSLIFLFYFLLISYVGFLIATAIMLFVFCWFMGSRKWAVIILLTVLGTTATYFIFEKLMLIQLHRGYLF